MSFVLDASSTFPWLFEDEATAQSDALLARLNSEGAYVPMLWFAEVVNGIGMAERRGRLTPSGVAEAVAFLQLLRLNVDTFASSAWSDALLSLMRHHRLTAYDAIYLELAIRLRLPLATGDRELRAAALAVGVELMPPSL